MEEEYNVDIGWNTPATNGREIHAGKHFWRSDSHEAFCKVFAMAWGLSSINLDAKLSGTRLVNLVTGFVCGTHYCRQHFSLATPGPFLAAGKSSQTHVTDPCDVSVQEPFSVHVLKGWCWQGLVCPFCRWQHDTERIHCQKTLLIDSSPGTNSIIFLTWYSTLMNPHHHSTKWYLNSAEIMGPMFRLVMVLCFWSTPKNY